MEDLADVKDWLETYRGRRVLITGHTGFKGAWLTAWLVELGAQVTGFAIDIPTSPSHFELLAPACQDLRGDITDQNRVAELVAEVRPEIVFHLAAQSLVRQSYDDPIATYQTNVIGTLALFEACRMQGQVRAIISATTDKVYRNNEWDWGYRESDSLGGSDPYSASKSCVEIMTASYRESFLRDSRMLIASARAGNVVGGGDWAADRLIPDIVRAAYGIGRLAIRNPEATRPWQHVLDPLAGYLLLGSRLLAGKEDFATDWNFGPVGRSNVRVRDIVEQIGTEFDDLEVDMAGVDPAKRESGLLELDSTRAVKRLGWRPVWEDQLVSRTLDWYRRFYMDGELLTLGQLGDYMSAPEMC